MLPLRVEMEASSKSAKKKAAKMKNEGTETKNVLTAVSASTPCEGLDIDEVESMM